MPHLMHHPALRFVGRAGVQVDPVVGPNSATRLAEPAVVAEGPDVHSGEVGVHAIGLRQGIVPHPSSPIVHICNLVRRRCAAPPVGTNGLIRCSGDRSESIGPHDPPVARRIVNREPAIGILWGPVQGCRDVARGEQVNPANREVASVVRLGLSHNCTARAVEHVDNHVANPQVGLIVRLQVLGAGAVSVRWAVVALVLVLGDPPRDDSLGCCGRCWHEQRREGRGEKQHCRGE